MKNKTLTMLAALLLGSTSSFAQSSAVSCDVNGDGEVNMADIVAVMNMMKMGGGVGVAGQKAYTRCPDDNHPHMIDLGLPSGTRWACCNVGTNEPVGVGDYYGWGETETKNRYTYDNYAHCVFERDEYGNSHTDWIDIGNDIAGTEWDAATAHWGAPWRLPSSDMAYELSNLSGYTAHEEGNVNGTVGVYIRGRNGAFIFVPAGGMFFDVNTNPNSSQNYQPHRVNQECHYWTSNVKYWNEPVNEYDSEKDWSVAMQWYNSTLSYLGFRRGYAARWYGFNVRPVRTSAVNGDVNDDGVVDVADINTIVKAIKRGGWVGKLYYYIGGTEPTTENYLGIATEVEEYQNAYDVEFTDPEGTTIYVLALAKATVKYFDPILGDQIPSEEVTTSDIFGYKVYKTKNKIIGKVTITISIDVK